jgi:hypothetical protein
MVRMAGVLLGPAFVDERGVAVVTAALILSALQKEVQRASTSKTVYRFLLSTLLATGAGRQQRPRHQRATGPAPEGSAERDDPAGGVLQLAGKREGLVSRDQPHRLDGLAGPAQELAGPGSAAALAGAGLTAENLKQADFTDRALGNAWGMGPWLVWCGEHRPDAPLVPTGLERAARQMGAWPWWAQRRTRFPGGAGSRTRSTSIAPILDAAPHHEEVCAAAIN